MGHTSESESQFKKDLPPLWYFSFLLTPTSISPLLTLFMSLVESCMYYGIPFFLMEYSFEKEVELAKPINQSGWLVLTKRSCQQNTKIQRKRKVIKSELWPLHVIHNQNVNWAESRIDLTCFSLLFFSYSLPLSCPCTRHTHTHTHTHPTTGWKPNGNSIPTFKVSKLPGSHCHMPRCQWASWYHPAIESGYDGKMIAVSLLQFALWTSLAYGF